MASKHADSCNLTSLSRWSRRLERGLVYLRLDIVGRKQDNDATEAIGASIDLLSSPGYVVHWPAL